MFAIIAVILFGIAAISDNTIGSVELIPLGLAFIGLSLLFDPWLIGRVRRQ